MKGQREMSQGHLNVDLNNQYSHILCVVPLDMSFYLCFLKSTHSRMCVCWWEGWGWGWRGMDRGIIQGESVTLISLAFLKFEISTDL